MNKHSSQTAVAFLLLAFAPPLIAQPLQQIRIADSQRYFVQADGTPFFWLGDTAWSIFNQASPEQVDQYFADRAEKGFNVVQGCIVLWNGLRRRNPDGELPFIDDDPSQINEAYFKNVDAIIDKAERHGLHMAILPVWIKGYIRNTDRHGDTLLDPEKMRAYCKFLGQRYGHRPIFWVLGGDWPGRDTRELSDAMAAGLIEGAGTDDILITYHPTGRQSSSFWFHDSDWLDFNFIQSGHFIETTNYQLVADDFAKSPVKPTLDSEPAYENITDRLIRDDPNARRIQAEDIRRSAYLAVFAGAAGHTYGCGEVYEFWDETQRRPLPGWAAKLTFEKSLDLPGASQMQYLRRLVESRPMLERVPDQSLILSENSRRATRRVQACRADDDSYAFVYLPGDQTVEIDLARLSGATLTAYWYDTRTGEATRIDDFDKTASREFTPPDSSVAGWVLVVDNAAMQFPPPGQATSNE
ncbi:glycoside hydrolase family 140 protein [Aeoliella sp. ICT_H6.2]|uniref:Glycoside hydrolase family 140 protein n=1 Tax=Aeoliella straminimaris TaxID=2954799 RepID=A0A9X2F857_9BACT|nr:glycoside hydrolase family 140 protein [Aeoliella straminimaris]MCO6044040.1 glycoside hydrolase family 140 protein [Aeoliella straminimaris]